MKTRLPFKAKGTLRLVKWDSEREPEHDPKHPEKHPACVEVLEWKLGEKAKPIYQRSN